MGLCRYCKPYLPLSLNLFLSLFFVMHVCMTFCDIDLLHATSLQHFAKSGSKMIDRGYRFETCNSSALDKSISDINTVTSSYTLLGFCLCFTTDEISYVM